MPCSSPVFRPGGVFPAEIKYPTFLGNGKIVLAAVSSFSSTFFSSFVVVVFDVVVVVFDVVVVVFEVAVVDFEVLVACEAARSLA